MTAILSLATFIILVLAMIGKAIYNCYDAPNYIADLSHPSIRYAQEVANRTRKVQVLIPNGFGSYDIVPAERVTLDSNAKFAGTVVPQPLKGWALPKNTDTQLNGAK